MPAIFVPTLPRRRQLSSRVNLVSTHRRGRQTAATAVRVTCAVAVHHRVPSKLPVLLGSSVCRGGAPAATAVQGTCVGQGRRRRQRPSVLQGNGVVPVPVHAAHAVAGTTAQWQGRRQRRRLHMCVHQDMRVQLAQWWVRLCDVGLGTSARRARATRWPTCAMPVARSAQHGAVKAMACHRR